MKKNKMQNTITQYLAHLLLGLCTHILRLERIWGLDTNIWHLIALSPIHPQYSLTYCSGTHMHGPLPLRLILLSLSNLHTRSH